MHLPMYLNTQYQLGYLAELGAGLNDRISRAAELFLFSSQSPKGDFPIEHRMYHKFNDRDIICNDGAITWSLLRLGYPIQDERMARAVDFLARVLLESDLKCHFNGDLPCAWGGAKALRAFSEIPPEMRTSEVNSAVEQAVEFFLSQDLARAEYPSKRDKPSKHWWKFGFPRNYQSDILQMLVTLTDLGYASDPRLSNALDFLESKRKKHGAWRIDTTLNKMPVKLVRFKDPSKWITWQALFVLKESGRFFL